MCEVKKMGTTKLDDKEVHGQLILTHLLKCKETIGESEDSDIEENEFNAKRTLIKVKKKLI